jgi:Zn-dependent protease
VLVILALLVTSLAGGQFPQVAPGHDGAAYWVAAVGAAAVFYASLLAHELAHAEVARRRHIEVDGIVLWLLGGVSKLRREATNADDEQRIALAGPATSGALAIVFFVLSRAFGAANPGSLVAAVFGWLGWLNAILAVFNLIPAFPLDGGRVLRGLVWRHTGDKRRATATAAKAGGAFGYMFVGIGMVEFLLGGGGFNGLWLAMIGWFLLSASRSEAEASARVERLRGLRVRDVMTPDPLTVPTWVSLPSLMEEGVRKRRLSSFPVVDDNGAFTGLVTLAMMHQVPTDRWAATTTAAIARPAGHCVTCGPDDDLGVVAGRMLASADRRAAVVDGAGHVVGILAPSDLHRTPFELRSSERVPA